MRFFPALALALAAAFSVACSKDTSLPSPADALSPLDLPSLVDATAAGDATPIPDLTAAASDACSANLSSDPDNCGACARRCCAGQLCSVGQCVTECAAGLTACAYTVDMGCVGGQCTDLASDPSHCGSCTNVCADGKRCVQGICA